MTAVQIDDPNAPLVLRVVRSLVPIVLSALWAGIVGFAAGVLLTKQPPINHDALLSCYAACEIVDSQVRECTNLVAKCENGSSWDLEELRARIRGEAEE